MEQTMRPDLMRGRMTREAQLADTVEAPPVQPRSNPVSGWVGPGFLLR